MTDCDFAEILKKMRAAGESNCRVSAMTHLFGIIFDREITDSGTNGSRIAKAAGVPDLITDGRNLAPYVTVRPEVRQRWQAGRLTRRSHGPGH